MNIARYLIRRAGGVMMLVLGIMAWSPGVLAAESVKLPPPAPRGAVSVEQALQARRTVRRFAAKPLNLQQVSQLLWGMGGVNDPRGLKTAPSAGATYPLDYYLVAGERGVTDLAPGVYHYRILEHALERAVPGDVRQAVARAALHQTWMAEAPVMVVITGEYRRCTARYGERGVRYTHMEAGHAGQNLFLQAEALGLGVGIVGAFEDRAVAQALNLPRAHEPLYILPVGFKH